MFLFCLHLRNFAFHGSNQCKHQNCHLQLMNRGANQTVIQQPVSGAIRAPAQMPGGCRSSPAGPSMQCHHEFSVCSTGMGIRLHKNIFLTKFQAIATAIFSKSFDTLVQRLASEAVTRVGTRPILSSPSRNPRGRKIISADYQYQTHFVTTMLSITL